MKKILVLLAVFISISALASCSSTKDNDIEINKETEMVNSASEKIIITRNKINEIVDRKYEMAVSSAKGDSAKYSSGKITADSAPEYLSVDFIKTLTADNYIEHQKSYKAYCEDVTDAIQALVDELPAGCVLSESPRWSNFGKRIKVNYMVLDPTKQPAGGEEFAIFVECGFAGSVYEGQFDKYYTDVDMDALSEKYGDTGDILVEMFGDLYFFNTETLVADRIELCPDYEEVKDAYLALFDAKTNEVYGEIVSE